MKLQFTILLFCIISQLVISIPVDSGKENKKKIIGFAIGNLSKEKDYSRIDTLISLRYKTDGKGYITSAAPKTNFDVTKKYNMKTIAMITNSFDINISKELLSNGINRQRFIENLIYNLKFDGYSGVNIDFEGIASADKGLFSLFIKEIYEALSPLGYELSVDVAAKTSNTDNGWGEPYDYEEIGKNCDYMIIMAYDEHYSQGDAGPVASYPWVKNVVSYAKTVVESSKIILGLPAYGYDWSILPTKAYGLDKINDIEKNVTEKELSFDTVSKTPYLKYTDSSAIPHSIWYENGESIKLKATIINEFFLGGAAIWRLGLESDEYLNSMVSCLFFKDINKKYLVENLPTKKIIKKYEKILAKYQRKSETAPYLYGKENKLAEKGESYFVKYSKEINSSKLEEYILLSKNIHNNPAEYLYAINAEKEKMSRANKYYSKLDFIGFRDAN